LRYELLVGLRYTRAKRRNHFISFISAISMAGIALGVAVLVTVLSFAFGLWVILASIVDPSGGSRGWPSLMAVVLFLGGVQLLCVGVLGEYVGRVYRETKGRPLYVVNDVIDPPGNAEPS